MERRKRNYRREAFLEKVKHAEKVIEMTWNLQGTEIVSDADKNNISHWRSGARYVLNLLRKDD